MKNLKIILLFIFPLQIFAQEKLSLSDAIQQALKSNLKISIAKNSSTITKQNNSYGNAGFLPTVTLNASGSRSSNNTKQEFITGAAVNRNGAASNFITSGIALNYTIFDGFGMFAEKERLKELEEKENFNLKEEIENIIVITVTNYLSIVKQIQLIKTTVEGIKIYEERIKIINNKIETGSGSKQELLQAKIDLNLQKSLLLKHEIELNKSKANLLLLLNQDLKKEYTTDNDFEVDSTLQINELAASISKENKRILWNQKNIDLAKTNIKTFNSFSLPIVNLTANYNFNQTKNEVGFILLNQNLGLNTGINASWNLFNGLKNKTKISEAKINLLQSKLVLEQVQKEITNSLYATYYTYQNNLNILKLETENLYLVKENITIALERYKLGLSGSFELITAQKSLEDAQLRLINAKYDCKISEIELLKLSGKINK
jgi:outer membrane protein TolC